MKKMDCKAGFQVKKVGSDTFIQGYANAAVVDRGKDFIKTDAWDLENYKKVPTILFNHDKDKPIGKAVDVRPTEQGLWIKAKISNSADAEISKIRDLIQEGMLNAFSVGFDSQEEQKNSEGVNDISRAELYEVSVVTLPMNQDSVFEFSAKSLKTMSLDEARATLLKSKGAWLAEAVHGKIYELEKSGSENRSALLAKITNASQASAEDISKVLAGDVTPVPENILSAFSEVLGLDLEDLKTLDAGDAELKKKAEELPPKDEADVESKDVDDGPSQPVVIALRIPKTDGLGDESDVSAMVTEAGYDFRGLTEEGDVWVVSVADPAQFGEPVQVDMGDGSFAMVAFPKSEEAEPEEQLAADAPKKPEDDAPGDPKPVPPPADDSPRPAPATEDPIQEAPKPEGEKPADAPKASADSNPGENEPADGDKPAEDQGQGELTAEAEQFRKDEEAVMNGGVPSWVADEAKWQQAVEASSTALGKLDFAFAMMWYFQNGGERKSESTNREKNLPEGESESKPGDNLYLEQARQTNVLLGELIKEFQALSAAMKGTPSSTTAPKKEETAEEEDTEENLEKAFYSNMEKFMEELDAKLKKNGA